MFLLAGVFGVSVMARRAPRGRPYSRLHSRFLASFDGGALLVPFFIPWTGLDFGLGFFAWFDHLVAGLGSRLVQRAFGQTDCRCGHRNGCGFFDFFSLW